MMARQHNPERDLLLQALFGQHADFSYDEETETNMRVRMDISRLDRIVGVAFEDPLLVAN
jgi:hypothetical protein